MRCFVIIAIFFSKHFLFCQYQWEKLENAPDYKGKQDDIYFINENIGWYVNGSGKIYKTNNGGKHWDLIVEKPGTFFRCIGFIDSLRGFVGNIGVDYFPGVIDTVPLYKTTDGGMTWIPVKYSGPTAKGMCAIDIIKVPYINAGILDYKYHIHAAGRVGNPAYLLTSEDGGETFVSKDMNEYCSFILDIKFLSASEGFICAAKGIDLEKTNAMILHTLDGGKTWKTVYQSKRPYENCWKMCFPSKNVGYATIQTYDPDTALSWRYIIKTTNGGKKWKEIKLVNDFKTREFGINFMNENIGWVGTLSSGFETKNGGKTWSKINFGKAVNKIRIIETQDKYIGFAIGSSIYKVTIDK